MTLKELYIACDNLDGFEDVYIHNIGKTLMDCYPAGELLDSVVDIFLVKGKKVEVWLK